MGKAKQYTGLSNRDMQTINGIFSHYPEVKSVYLFGSRAMGNYNKGSDIDLALMNDDISVKTIRSIKADFNESSLPYVVDLKSFANIKNSELRKHIKRVALPIYTITQA